MKKSVVGLCMLLCLAAAALSAESKYALSWLELNPEFTDTWSWTPAGGDLEGRFYQSSEVTSAAHTVLILCAKESSSYILAFNKLLEVIESRLPSMEFYFFNMSKNNEQAARVVEFGATRELDMIIAMGSEAMVFAAENLKGADIPIVTCINKDPVLLGFVDDYKSGSNSNIAYTSVNVPLNVNIEWLYKLRPNLNAMVVLYDPNHSQVVASEVEPLFRYLSENDIACFDAPVASGPAFKEDLADTIQEGMDFLNRNDPGLKNCLYWITSSTNIFSELEVVSAHTGIVPVASSVPNTVNESESSAMMAFGIDRRNSANLAALYVVEILTGNSLPGELPVGVVTPPDISISFRTAKRIGETIPFEIFENASFIYGYDGSMLRSFGKTVSE